MASQTIQTKPCSKALKTRQDALIFLAKDCDSMMGKEAQLGGWLVEVLGRHPAGRAEKNTRWVLYLSLTNYHHHTITSSAWMILVDHNLIKHSRH